MLIKLFISQNCWSYYTKHLLWLLAYHILLWALQWRGGVFTNNWYVGRRDFFNNCHTWSWGEAFRDSWNAWRRDFFNNWYTWGEAFKDNWSRGFRDLWRWTSVPFNNHIRTILETETQLHDSIVWQLNNNKYQSYFFFLLHFAAILSEIYRDRVLISNITDWIQTYLFFLGLILMV